MKYKKFGKLDWEASVLGYGTMRLPHHGESYRDNANINEPEATKIIRYAIDQGVNYIDTAYTYHTRKCEEFLGKALKDGYREKVKLATKMPPNVVNKYEDFDIVLNEQMKKLQTDHIDFYLLHSMRRTFWDKLRNMDVLNWAEKAIADGRIGHLGFSFHDNVEVFKEMVDAYDKWALVQIQYNYMDIELQAGTEGLQYAADKGLAVVIMEPLRGGQLSKEQPPSIKKLYEEASVNRKPADLSLQWLWNQPEVSVVISGMTTMDNVKENIASAETSGVGSLSDKELDLVDKIREEYERIHPVPCTACGYCMPCPNDVNIPHAFFHYNNAIIYDDASVARYWYRDIPVEQWADRCEECHECEENCPQEIEIVEWLKKAHGFLGPLKK